MKNKKYAIFIAIVAVLSFVLITAGVTYAFFSYIKTGTTENTIEAGSVTFHYDETTHRGRGISITDAMPVALEEETAAFLADTTQGKIFDFNITAKTGRTVEMPYYITARVKDGSTLDPNLVRVYLTKVDGSSETAVLNPTYFGTLSPYTPVANRFNENVLYTETIPVNTSNYNQDFRLRMWLGAAADYSMVPDKCEKTLNDETTDVTTTYATQTACEEAVEAGATFTWVPAHYPLNDKTFAITVNVYSTGNVNTSGSTTTSYNANQIQYDPSSVYPSTTCTGSNQTVECALDELNTLLG